MCQPCDHINYALFSFYLLPFLLIWGGLRLSHWDKKTKNKEVHVRDFVTKLVLFMLSLHFRVPKLDLFRSSLPWHAQKKIVLSKNYLKVVLLKYSLVLCDL